MNKNPILGSNSIQSNKINLYIEVDSTVNPFMELELEKKSENAKSPPTPIQEQAAQVDNGGEKAKTTRHPRWTREETIFLIEGKKAVENGGKQVSGNGSSLGSDHLESKWDMVSSFCQQLGVNRTPVQCQKRWGNILSDFRKIKKWESNIKEEAESFWMMRNDERRERKLPGFFDREVYNVLDRKVSDATVAFPLTTLIKTTPRDDQGEAAALEDEEAEAEAIVDGEKIAWSTEEEAMEATRTRMEVPTQLEAREAIMEETARKTPTHPLPNSGEQSLTKSQCLLCNKNSQFLDVI